MNNKKISSDILLTKEIFQDLYNTQNAHCVSIYIPTFRAGKEVDEGQGQLMLKNCLKEVSLTLQDYGLTKGEVEMYLEPVRKLLDDIHFWRTQSDGLAIFFQKNKLMYYTLPIHFEKYVYVANHFYLKPLLPLFTGDGRFFLLCISVNEVKFYEGNRHNITEIAVEDLVPLKLQDAVGYDYEPKFLQFRSGVRGGAGNVARVAGKSNATGTQGKPSGAIFHGHGSGKEDKKDELVKYFRAVDNGLMEILRDEDVPLVLSCVDYYYPIYKEVSMYSASLLRKINGNTDMSDVFMLHEKAWLEVNDFYQSEKNNKLKQFLDLSATGKTSWKEDEIVVAALNGKVDTLFIDSTRELYGVYDIKNQQLRIDSEKQMSNASLVNLCATHTFMQGGKVYLMPPEDMPVKEASMNALFRYSL